MNRDNIRLIQSTLTKLTTKIWRSKDQGRNNTVLEGDDSLDGNDIIEWGKGQENSHSI